MKKNRFSGFTLILLMIVITIVHAQDQKPANAEEIATKTTTWMKTNLNLNENQVEQAKEVNLKYARKNLDLKGSSLGRRQILQTLGDNDFAKDRELKNIFTAEQYKTWLVMREIIKEQLKEKAKSKKD